MSEQIKTISAEELYYTPISHKESEMIVEHMIPQGLTILAGAAKSGKSWLTLDMGLAVAAGVPFLEKETLRCGVLYFALEDTAARLQKRLHRINEDGPPDNLYLAIECPPLGGGLLDSLNDHLKSHPDIRLIIIDTLQMIR
ncbi:MAG: AAA family ATPase, partial [Clostridia bacterium]|nr:AAA family ATPase [Clostridia bacterium]